MVLTIALRTIQILHWSKLSQESRNWPMANFEISIIFVIKLLFFSVWHRNRLIFAGLEMVHISHTEKSCITWNYRYYPTNIKIKIIKLIRVFLAWAFDPSGLTKLYPIIIFFILISARKAVYNSMQ